MMEAAERAILPRFRALAADEVEEKSPGELVTVADREAEAILAAGLAPLLPGSRVLGEEACSADPRLLDSLADGAVWLVDPLDGTANFAAGRPVFAVMVALLRDGETQAAWLLEPLSGRLARAERGGGAWLGERRLSAVPRAPGARLRGSMGRFMPEEMNARLEARLEAGAERLPGMMSAGVEYPMIAAGERDFAFYWRTLAWDHAAGVLFVIEAGGKAARPDGSAYRPAEAGKGMLVAASPDRWEMARELLFGGEGAPDPAA
ncbi:MAG: inositol monophosphatase [Sphingomonadaceae bacterium]|nr:inositol monophosphatase [Sphingomonadaceae bacterium]